LRHPSNRGKFTYILAKLFVEGYGTPFEVADCGEAILAAVGAGAY
jgi:hypothetical protein